MRFNIITAIIALHLSLAPHPGICQDSASTVKFIHAGTIEFERKENQRNEFTGEGERADEIRKNMPEYKITYFDLFFSGNISLFRPGRENPDNARLWPAAGGDNIVYANRNTNHQVSQKNAWGTMMLLDDSLRTIKWRITTDTRTIAGFECHRATTVIMDSVFVVAFFADEIVPPSGPESFGGLPGTILGMVIPKLHTSWYATKVVLEESKPLVPPSEGKKMTYAEMFSTLQRILKNWGNWGKPLMMRMML